MPARARARVRACACVRACVRACVCVRARLPRALGPPPSLHFGSGVIARAANPQIPCGVPATGEALCARAARLDVRAFGRRPAALSAASASLSFCWSSALCVAARKSSSSRSRSFVLRRPTSCISRT
eukprot:6209619-Pleurochrysis_carterae.AAC.1